MLLRRSILRSSLRSKVLAKTYIKYMPSCLVSVVRLLHHFHSPFLTLAGAYIGQPFSIAHLLRIGGTPRSCEALRKLRTLRGVEPQIVPLHVPLHRSSSPRDRGCVLLPLSAIYCASCVPFGSRTSKCPAPAAYPHVHSSQ